MSAFAPASRAIALALGVILGGAAGAGPPERVVSLNLCTDQLAMMLGAPGQVVAVSRLAADPRSSVMWQEAAAFRQVRGQAEEVFLLRPDLVLAGTYTTPATVDLLRRLGVRVEVVPVPSALSHVRAQLETVGRAMGREAEAEWIAAAFEDDLAAMGAAAPGPRAALYGANGWTGGGDTLAGDILAAAGFRNAAVEAGLSHGGFLSVEELLMLAPDVVVTGAAYPGHSRSEEVPRHPALDHLRRAGRVSDADWVCALPQVLRAVRRLAEAREALE